MLLVSVERSVVILRDSDGGPLLAEVGQDLSLLCNYQVMSDSLYSIKWYRDDKEFFRYIPRGNVTSINILGSRFVLGSSVFKSEIDMVT